jgi:hypothetical protein
MKIVIIPGVGYQTGTKSYSYFGDKIKSQCSCEYEIFYWNHDFNKVTSDQKTIFKTFSDELKSNTNISYNALRSNIVEILQDFEYALKFGASISVPSADYYIGHSAGSLFALSQDKPCAIMGSPAGILKCLPTSSNVNNLFVSSIIDNDKPILNLVNKYDVIAYPLASVQARNVYFSGSSLNPSSYFPFSAHAGYWESDFVINETLKHIKSVVK